MSLKEILLKYRKSIPNNVGLSSRIQDLHSRDVPEEDSKFNSGERFQCSRTERYISKQSREESHNKRNERSVTSQGSFEILRLSMTNIWQNIIYSAFCNIESYISNLPSVGKVKTINYCLHHFHWVYTGKRKKEETKIFLNGQSQSQSKSQPHPQPHKEVLKLNAKTDLTSLDPKLVSM